MCRKISCVVWVLYSLHLLLWNFYFCRVIAIQTHRGNCAEEQMQFWWRLSGNKFRDFMFFFLILLCFWKSELLEDPPSCLSSQMSVPGFLEAALQWGNNWMGSTTHRGAANRQCFFSAPQIGFVMYDHNTSWILKNCDSIIWALIWIGTNNAKHFSWNLL